MGTGLLAALPLFLAVTTVLALRQVDEYGRQLHTRAAISLTALEPALHFHTPPG